MNCQVSEEAAVAKIEDRCGGKVRGEEHRTRGWQDRGTLRLPDAAPSEGELIKPGSLTERMPEKVSWHS